MKPISMREDNGQVRRAIEIEKDAYESIDIVDNDHNLLMRLNIYHHSNDTCSCDVIAAPKSTAMYRIKAWLRGHQILNTLTRAPFISISWPKNTVLLDNEPHEYADKVTGG